MRCPVVVQCWFKACSATVAGRGSPWQPRDCVAGHLRRQAAQRQPCCCAGLSCSRSAVLGHCCGPQHFPCFCSAPAGAGMLGASMQRELQHGLSLIHI
eukprot:3488208-Alexandrium_andersonii.AAC.1